MAAIISSLTRNHFRDAIAQFTLREIRRIFSAGEICQGPGFDASAPKARLRLVEHLYSGLDFASPEDTRRLALAYDEAIEQLRQPSYPDRSGTVESLIRRIQNDGLSYANGRFSSHKLTLVEPAAMAGMNKADIEEHVEKARAKITAIDFAGAITSSYTLVEVVLKGVLTSGGIPFNADQGDIRELYKLVAQVLNLNSGGEHIETYFKPILQGLRSLVAGLYEIANKAGDRHARRYNPARRHATLAVNAAFTLCEFLIDSAEYQKEAKRMATTA